MRWFFHERSRQYQSEACSYMDTLRLLSGKQFVIVIFTFAFRSTRALQPFGPTNRKNTTLRRECIYCFQPLHFPLSESTIFPPFPLKAATFRRAALCGLFLFEDKNQPHSESRHILHRRPIDKEKQANKGIVIIYKRGAAGVGLHLTADQSRCFSGV